MQRFTRGIFPHITLIGGAGIILLIGAGQVSQLSDIFLDFTKTPWYVLALLCAVFLLAAAFIPRLKREQNNLAALYVRIPFITVLSEEVIFRAVLLGLLLGTFSTVWSVVAASIIFGMWHIYEPADKHIPTRQKTRKRSVDIAVTAIAGAIFSFLTIATDTIVLAFVLHWLVNSLGVIISQHNTVLRNLRKLY